MRQTRTAEIKDVRDGSKSECDLRERDWYKACRVLFLCHLTLKNLIDCESETNKDIASISLCLSLINGFDESERVCLRINLMNQLYGLRNVIEIEGDLQMLMNQIFFLGIFVFVD